MKSSLILACAAALALPASAQDTTTEPDWDLLNDPGKKSLIAYVPATTGLTLAVRCVDGALDGVIAGLPAFPRGRPTRPLNLGFGDIPPHETRWSVTTDRTVAISDYPAAFARSLVKGGRLNIVIPGGAGEGRNLRHDLMMPPSSGAIEQVLTACGRPLVDPRDALLPDIEDNGLPLGLKWARPPRPRYPNTNFASGYAVISCVGQPDGTVDQCQVESEQPARGRFGEAALRSVGDARLDLAALPPGRILPHMIAFRVNFYMDGYERPREPE